MTPTQCGTLMHGLVELLEELRKEIDLIYEDDYIEGIVSAKKDIIERLETILLITFSS